MEDQYYRIGQTAKYLGVSIQTIKMWLKNQKIQSIRTLGGEQQFSRSEINRILGQKTPIPKKTILYSRVSSRDQIHDLESQEALLEQFAVQNNYVQIVKFKDVGSELNPKRLGFTKMLKRINNQEVAVVITPYRDRLIRFGFEYLESYFQSHQTKIIVLNQEGIQDPQKELVDDLIAIITSFSDKIYGLRSHKIKKLIRNIRAEFQSKDCKGRIRS